MTPLEVVTALVGGMDATDRAKVAALLGISAKPAERPQLTACQKSGHAYRIMTPAGWFSPATMTCTKCGRTAKSK